jgi:hypothetical protein
MIAICSSDARVRREAEAVASIPGNSVTILSLKEKETPRTLDMNGVKIQELDIAKYRGKSGVTYIFSYILFTLLAFVECTKQFFRKSLDVLHVHNMPNFLVFAGLIPFLSGKPIILDIHDTMVRLRRKVCRAPSDSSMGLRLEKRSACGWRATSSVSTTFKAASSGGAHRRKNRRRDERT